MTSRNTTRRDFVIGTLIGVPGAALLSSCGGAQTADGGSSGTSGAAGAGGSDSSTCTVYPQQTEGAAVTQTSSGNEARLTVTVAG